MCSAAARKARSARFPRSEILSNFAYGFSVLDEAYSYVLTRIDEHSCVCSLLSPQVAQVRGMATEKQSKYTPLWHLLRIRLFLTFTSTTPHILSLQSDCFHEKPLEDYQLDEDGVRGEIKG